MFLSRSALSSLVHKYRLGSSFRYDVYNDLSQDARWLEYRNASTRDLDHPIYKYGNFKDLHGLDLDMKLYVEMETASNRLYTQYLLCTLTMLMRLIKVIDFQPKLALVSKTIEKAAGPLSYFSGVFVTIVTCFSICANLVFGSISGNFSTISSSALTCFNLFLGDLGVNDEMMSSTMSGPWLCFLFCYLIVTFFVLLNILLAIIVDAYVEVKDSASHTPGVFQDLQNVGRNTIAKCQGKPRLEQIINALSSNHRDGGINRKITPTSKKENSSSRTSVVPTLAQNSQVPPPPKSHVDSDAIVLQELENTLDKTVSAIGVDHDVGNGKQVTFPLTIDFLLKAYADDPCWKSADIDAKRALKQMHRLLSQNHKGIGDNGLEDVQIAALQRSLADKVLHHLRAIAKQEKMSKQ